MIVRNVDAFRDPPACVLLDLDHTLYDYPSCNAAGMEAAQQLAQAQLSVPPADFARCFDDARAELKARLGGVASSHNRLLYFQRTIERAGLATQPFAALQLEQAFWRAYLDAAVLFEGVLEFLDDLRIAGVPTVIVTDLTVQIQFRKLIALGLDRVVDWVVTSEESGRDKPHPAGFELALAKLGGVEGPVWMIGDSLECDLSGAKRALGAVTLQKAHPRGPPPAPHPDIDAVFSSFNELRKAFRKLG